MRAGYLGKWRHALLQSGAIDRSQIPANAWQTWQPEHGDRRQELAFIGIDLDPNAIRKRLDDCAAEAVSF